MFLSDAAQLVTESYALLSGDVFQLVAYPVLAVIGAGLVTMLLR